MTGRFHLCDYWPRYTTRTDNRDRGTRKTNKTSGRVEDKTKKGSKGSDSGTIRRFQGVACRLLRTIIRWSDKIYLQHWRLPALHRSVRGTAVAATSIGRARNKNVKMVVMRKNIITEAPLVFGSADSGPPVNVLDRTRQVYISRE